MRRRHPRTLHILLSGDLLPFRKQSVTLSSPTFLIDLNKFRGYPHTTLIFSEKKLRKPNSKSRTWEGVSAAKAKRVYPQLDPLLLENKFRWGAFKAFAYTRGKPVKEITYPVAAMNGMNWLIEHNYAKLTNDGMLTLRKKGSDLYTLLFKNRGPQDFPSLT